MWSTVYDEKMFKTIFETNVLTSAISIEKILMFNSSTSLLKSFDENAKMIKRFDVDCDEMSIALFWKADLSDTRLKVAIWRISSSNCTIISFNNLSILLLICVCVDSFEKIFESEAKSKAIIIDFELNASNASKSRERLLFFHSTLKKRYMIFFVVIIRYILVSS